MRVARLFTISGRVQGVGFRYFTETAAVREGIDGWVRNTPDGRVEIAAEGEPDAMARFESSIRLGPGGAHVTNVNIDIVEAAGTQHGFSVR